MLAHDSLRAAFTPVAYAVVLVTLVVVVIALVVALFRALSSGDVPKIESWKGFGGGSGGWLMSRSLALLIGAVLFASLAAVTVRSAASDLKSATPPADETQRADSAAAASALMPADSGKAGADTTHTKTTTRQ